MSMVSVLVSVVHGVRNPFLTSPILLVSDNRIFCDLLGVVRGLCFGQYE